MGSSFNPSWSRDFCSWCFRTNTLGPNDSDFGVSEEVPTNMGHLCHQLVIFALVGTAAQTWTLFLNWAPSKRWNIAPGKWSVYVCLLSWSGVFSHPHSSVLLWDPQKDGLLQLRLDLGGRHQIASGWQDWSGGAGSLCVWVFWVDFPSGDETWNQQVS